LPFDEGTSIVLFGFTSTTGVALGSSFFEKGKEEQPEVINPATQRAV
jgi:hypothetical protein